MIIIYKTVFVNDSYRLFLIKQDWYHDESFDRFQMCIEYFEWNKKKLFPVIEFSMRKSAEQKESIFIRIELNGAVCKHVDNTQDATIDVSVLFLHICGNGHIERKSTP